MELPKKIKYQAGDIFVIPMHDGRFAICQIVTALHDRLKKMFSFGVLSIQNHAEYAGETDYLTFKNYKDSFQIIFTASDHLRKGKWKIIDHRSLSTEKQHFQYFNFAGGLYHGDEYIRQLPIAEYNQYIIASIAGYELVQNYLVSLDAKDHADEDE